MEVTAGMKELLTYIARNLVDHPDAVSEIGRAHV